MLRRALLLLAVLVVAAPAPAAAAPDQAMVFEAPGELLDDGSRDPTLDEIRALGVTRVRALVYWRTFAPDATSPRRPAVDLADPAAYSDAWGRLDRLLAAAAARGITVQLTLTGPVPKWGSRSRRSYLRDPDPVRFEQFVQAVGTRYRDQVATWSIWNEPNQPQFLLPQYERGRAVSPRIYRRLYQAARRALERTGNSDDTILMGETSPIGNERRVVEPLDFLRGTLCLDSRYRKRRGCAALDADGWAHHPYTRSVGPSFVPKDRDDVTIGVIPRLTRALDRAARAGALARSLGVHLTEFGIQSSPDPFAVSLARQAEYIAISERIAYLNPRVEAFSQYLLRDDRPRRARSRSERYGGFESGLRRSDGRRKPAYDAFRTPLVATEYRRDDVLWGRVRPAEGRTQIVLEARRPGGEWTTVGTVTTSTRAVWGARVRHREGQRYRVVWAAPDGRTFTGPPVRAY